MNRPLNPIVIIPARLAATRFPNKPLAPIHGEPMIVQVWRRAMEAKVGPVLVAAGDQAIVDAITKIGGVAVLTNPNLHDNNRFQDLQLLDTSDNDFRIKPPYSKSILQRTIDSHSVSAESNLPTMSCTSSVVMVKGGDSQEGIPRRKAGCLRGPYSAPYMTRPCLRVIAEYNFSAWIEASKNSRLSLSLINSSTIIIPQPRTSRTVG